MNVNKAQAARRLGITRNQLYFDYASTTSTCRPRRSAMRRASCLPC